VDAVEQAVEALRAGEPVILPTDTVYGLCASPHRAADVARLYALKGRAGEQPTALLCSSLDSLLECVPELEGPPAAIARAVLPGPYTLVFPNPHHRFAWLAGDASTIGVRVPELPAAAARVLETVGAVAATSANLPGQPAPKRLDEVPERLLAGAAAVVDGGELPGVASTVVDCTGDEPVILREGVVPAVEALERVGAARA
jgi:L-threonylcarbamoyladenylate synthase